MTSYLIIFNIPGIVLYTDVEKTRKRGYNIDNSPASGLKRIHAVKQ